LKRSKLIDRLDQQTGLGATLQQVPASSKIYHA